MSTDLNKVVDMLSDLKVTDMVEVIKMLEEKWGVTAAAPVAVAASSTSSEPAAAEKTSFDVILQSVGTSKINVIKAIRDVTGLGLTEAKTLAESAPKEVKVGVSKADAEEMKKKLEAAGATVELK